MHLLTGHDGKIQRLVTILGRTTAAELRDKAFVVVDALDLAPVPFSCRNGEGLLDGR